MWNRSGLLISWRNALAEVIIDVRPAFYVLILLGLGVDGLPVDYLCVEGFAV